MEHPLHNILFLQSGKRNGDIPLDVGKYLIKTL